LTVLLLDIGMQTRNFAQVDNYLKLSITFLDFILNCSVQIFHRSSMDCNLGVDLHRVYFC